DVLPRVSVGLLSTSYNGRLTRRAQDFYGNPIQNPNQAFVYTSTTSQDASLQWSVQGRSLSHRLARQDAVEHGRRAARDATRHTVRAEVRRAFFEALAQRELLGAERELGGAREADLEAARRLFTLASGSQVDVLTAELEI